MSEIRIDVDDQYLQPLLDFLRTLNYVHINKVSGALDQLVTTDTAVAGQATISADEALLQALKTPISTTDIEAALLNTDYHGTDLIKLGQFAADLDIPQSAEDLISQLSE
jgi:vacuolar-type H+-ATPase subunit I/STV1